MTAYPKDEIWVGGAARASRGRPRVHIVVEDCTEEEEYRSPHTGRILRYLCKGPTVRYPHAVATFSGTVPRRGSIEDVNCFTCLKRYNRTHQDPVPYWVVNGGRVYA